MKENGIIKVLSGSMSRKVHFFLILGDHFPRAWGLGPIWGSPLKFFLDPLPITNIFSFYRVKKNSIVLEIFVWVAMKLPQILNINDKCNSCATHSTTHPTPSHTPDADPTLMQIQTWCRSKHDADLNLRHI